MKKILLLSLFSTLCVNGMVEKVESLANVIKGNMDNPSEVLVRLKGFEPHELKEYRDRWHNNLIHIAVQELMAKKEIDEDVPAGSELLIEYLVNCGVNINEVNDLRKEPLFLAADWSYELGDVLEGLGARPIYISIAPEIRAIQKWLRSMHANFYVL